MLETSYDDLDLDGIYADENSFEVGDRIVATQEFESSDNPSIQIITKIIMDVKQIKSNGNILVDNDDWTYMHWLSKQNKKYLRKIQGPPSNNDRGFAISPSGILRHVQVHGVRKNKYQKNEILILLHYVGFSENYDEEIIYNSERYFREVPKDAIINEQYNIEIEQLLAED